jgi:hypothetical protein
MRNRFTSVVIAVVALLAGLDAQSPSRPAEVTLAVAGRTNVTPWIASRNDFVAVAWGASQKGAGDVFLAVSRDGGRRFDAPVQVNAIAGEARISGEIAPRVALSNGVDATTPEIVVLWNAKKDGTGIRLARSRDGGRTFTPAQTLQASGAPGDRGWAAMALDSKGAAHAIWLDHRGMATGGEHSGHKGEHDGVAMAQRSALYYASASPAGLRERSLFPGVCYCCKTAMAIAPDGAIYTAWRHVFEGNFRDIALSVSRDGGATFSPMTRVNQDGWSINGCPDDGPAMAIDGSGTVHLAWPTVSNETGVILYATSRDGRSFSKPVQVPTFGTPKASHPQVAIDGSGQTFVGWDEVRSGVRSAGIVQVKSTKDGVTFGVAESLGPASMYPVMARAERGLVAAFTSGPPDQSVIKVRRIK